MPRLARPFMLLAALAALLGPGRLAMAQVPPHVPGSICFTPQFWCWVNPPGPVGAFCTCFTPNGPVGGRLN